MNVQSTERPAPSYSNPDPRAIAVVGMSISAPGGEARGLDTEAFYQFLSRRGSGIITVPANRWNADAYYGTAPGKINTTKGAFIPEMAYGDLQEFGITPAEASQMSTSQIVLQALHQAFNALQRSGVDYRATNTGVYVGCTGANPPFEMDETKVGPYHMTGTYLSITANRINYVYDLLGPSLLVDTACSSALTAMHLALQAIRNGDCEQAVVAGFNFVPTPLETISFSQLGVLSPDGMSKSFDDGANGYARGDIAGAVVVKRHDKSVKDHNHILATLVGSSLTSCGSIMGSLTTPSANAQTMAISTAYADAGLKPHHADFVELHGTGTVVGDSIEANASGAIFSEGREGRELVIGSVKSNVGHGEMGAYMSSLIKVIMMLSRRQILPNGTFEKPSAKIEFAKYNMRVATTVELMRPQDAQRGLVASISSFGIGGACGHTVLREHEPRPPLANADTLKDGPFLFSFGALTPKSCNSLVDIYKSECAGTDPLVLCEHLGGRSRQLQWRTFAVANSLDVATFPEPVLVGKRPNPLIFCFSGQGPQHWKQGRVLMAKYTAFRDSIYACDQVHKAYTGTSFLHDTGLFVADPPEDAPLAESLVWPANIISVAITLFQIALFDLFSSFGLTADAIVGHSIGETAVLYASGAMSREMTVKIAIARGRALALIDNIGGTMVAISGCDAATVQSYIDAVFSLTDLGADQQQLYIAALNSPTDVGVSGSTPLVELLTNYISNFSGGATARKLRVSTAVHSPLVDACEAVYRAELELCFSQYTGPFSPKTLVMSSVTGAFKNDPYTVDYLWNNLRQPVQFSTAIPALIARFGEKTIFVEMSPHPVLSQYIKQMGAHESLPGSARPPTARRLRSGVKPSTEVDVLLSTLGNLLLGGINSINFSVLNGCAPGILSGPAYPMEGKVWPFAPQEVNYLRRLLPPRPPLNSTRLRVSPNIPAEWMGDHIVDQSNIVPAAAYIEMALEFGGVTQVWDCHFAAACAVTSDAPPVVLEVLKNGINWTVKSSEDFRRSPDDLQWTEAGPKFNTVHAYGKLGYGTPLLGRNAVSNVDVDAVLNRCFASYGHDDFYNEIETVSQFGESFSRIEKIHLNSDEAICWIRADGDALERADYVFYPPLMDAVFQVGLTWNLLHEKINIEGMNQTLFLPHSLRRGFRNDGSVSPVVLPANFKCYAHLVEWALYHHTVDVYVLDENEDVIFTFEGTLILRYLIHFRDKHPIGLRFNCLSNRDNQLPIERYEVQWQPRSLPPTRYESTALETTAENSEDLLAVLDYLAIKYSAATVKALPPDFSPALFDRGRYLAWAKKQALKLPTIVAPSISGALHEQYNVLFELASRLGAAQKDIMKSSTAAVEALFRDDIMSKVYELPPFVGGVFDQAVAMFIRLVQDAVAAGKRVVRVLEVGAGTGRFTALLGQALLRAAGIYYVDYVATDVSISLAQDACEKSPWPTMTPKTLDLRMPVAQQGFDANSFDIIVGFDVIHAVPDIRKTLDSLHALLAPGGHLAIIDIDGSCFRLDDTPGAAWMDFIFGAFSEWFGVLEKRADTRHCTLTMPEWNEALHVSGFSDTMFIAGAADTLSHIAFISQAQPLPLIKCTNSVDDLTLVRHFEVGGEVSLVQFIRGLDSTRPYSLWLHTDTRTENSRLVGIVRSLRREYAVWTVKLVIFELPWTSAQQEPYIREHLLPLSWIDSEILVNADGYIRVPRVVAAPAPSLSQTRRSHSVELGESQIWRSYPSPLNSDDIEVHTAFLSLSPIFPGFCEFSGTVTALGVDVSDTSLLGQRVVGLCRSVLGSTVVCRQAQVALLPGGMSLESAAAIIGGLLFVSSVIIPALSALPKSTRIMLHMGPISAAALATHRYLEHQGFNTIVTAINPSGSGIPDVYDARQYEVWSVQAREKFNGGEEALDFVFNFDSTPDVAAESIALLCRDGTFVQVGGDLHIQTRTGHRHFSLDADMLYREISVQAAMPFLPLIPLPAINVFHLSQLAEASRHAQTTGSAVLLDMHSGDAGLSIHRAGVLKGTSTFNPRATYVVIGGVGGLGIALARCLVENGARHIVLTSRSGEGAFTRGHLVLEKRILDALRCQSGVTVDIVALDCLDEKGTKVMFAKFARDVAGVFYLPLVLNDQIFANLDTEAQWKPVLDAKTKGLQVLLDAVDVSSLDFLLLTSSIVTITGSDGQANYAAAQKQMEAIGEQIPNAVSVIVPPITDSGAFVRGIPRGQGRNVMLEKYKMLGMSVHQLALHCIDAIRTLENAERTSVYIPAMNWKNVIALIPSYNHSFMRHLLVKETANTSFGNGIKEKSILRTCATVLSMDVEAVQENIPLSTYGLDSLTSVRLSGILKAQFGIQVSQLQLLGNYMSVEKLQTLWEEQERATVPEKIARTESSGGSGAERDDLSETILRLNNISEGFPLFLVHGAGGGVGVLRKLAQTLICPVFGIQDTPTTPLDGSMSTLARFYLDHIKMIQPFGPYRLGGFSFGSSVAYAISLLLSAEGEEIETLIMLDSAPTLFARPQFQDRTRRTFVENKLQEEVLDIIGDVFSSGVLEDGLDIVQQFKEHVVGTAKGELGTKWITRFFQAYAAHLIMGLRAGIDSQKSGPRGHPWPAKRTILVRARDGICRRPHCAGASIDFDLEKWVPELERFDIPGTHIGILNPGNGLPAVLNECLAI
ncbi:hypothetical protein DFH09DRAFT_1043015 [Mycena vulgaris]|nr:hypothetical protein DFH09DRAFT_1043015 [Mycena vulgaris]